MQLISPKPRLPEWLHDLLVHYSPAALVVYALMAYTLLLALLSLVAAIDFRLMTNGLFYGGDQTDPLYEMGTSLGFWGTFFFFLNFILATRWRWVEQVFGGLDRVYQLHALVGKAALIFIVTHMGILLVQAVPEWSLVGEYVIPGLNLGYTLGVIGTAGMVFLVAATLWVKLPYQIWLSTHKFMIVPFVAGTGHAIVLQQDWYMYLLTTVGGYAWFYSTFRYQQSAPHADGTVVAAHAKGNIHELTMQLDRDFAVMPGQFVFFTVTDSPAIPNELHPFSVSGIEEPRGLRLSIKQLGDYTGRLGQIVVGNRIRVYGPYGMFGRRTLAVSGHQVWIAGGIGITPFLSLLQHYARHETCRPVTFVWSVRHEAEAVYSEQIDTLLRSAPNIRFHLHVTSAHGYLNDENLARWLGGQPLAEAHYFLCGPIAMMRSLRRQLRQHGVKQSQIVSEEFVLR